MDKYLTRDQMQTILDTRPKGMPLGSAVDMYVKNGWTIEGVNEPKSTVDKTKDIGIGFAKGVGRTALDVGQNLQTIGQGALLAGGVSPETVAKTGFQSLDTSSPQGKSVEQKLAPTNADQKLGGQLETGAELLVGGGAGLIKDVAVGGTKLLSKGVKPLTGGVKKVGEKIYDSAFTPNVKEAENILAYEASLPSTFSKLYGTGVLKGNPAFKPITTAETALRAGIAGTEKQVGVQAKRVGDTIYRDEIAPAVEGLKQRITKEELFSPLKARIDGIIDPSKKVAYQNALDGLADDYKNIKDFSFKEAQQLKSELAQFTPAKVFRGQDVANETRMLQADMAHAIRQKTYDALSDINVKQKYIDYGNLQELEKVGVRAISEAGLKGGFGGFWSTLYDKAMTPIKTVGGKTLYHIGDKLEVKAPKSFKGKTLGDYLRSIGYLAPQVGEKAISSDLQ